MNDPNLSAAPDAPHAQPLPSEWLPDGAPPDSDPVWGVRTERILGAAELEWARLVARQQTTAWLSEMGSWLRPAAVLAAAAAALLFATSDRVTYAGPAISADDVALRLVAAEGDPVAIWTTLGVTADPVLALLTLEDHTAWMTGGPPQPPAGDRR
jgi:hypothetical protein